jgi:rhodanese-related sulfurtransferase
MRRDLPYLVAVVLLGSVVAAATNVFGHKMEWIRKPLDPVGAVTSASSGRPAHDGAGQVEARAADGVEGPGAASKPNNAVTTPQRRGGTVDMDAIIEDLANGTAVFVDAREPSEYAAGHLRGAINLPSNAIYDDIDRVRSVVLPDQRLIVYCGGSGCEASSNVSDALRRDFDFKNVFVYEKGWEEIATTEAFKKWIVEGESS